MLFTNRIKFDDNSKGLLLILLLSQLYFNNGIYLFCCVLTLFLLFYYLQQPYKPGVFTFIALHHVLQVIAGVWLCNYLGKDINFRSLNTSVATIASLVGILVMFTPLAYYQSKLPSLSLLKLREYAYSLSTVKTMYCYIALFFFTSILASIAFLYSGFTQVIISLMKIKWFFFLLFGYLSVLKKEKRIFFYLFIFLEIISGVFSYFSDFKTVIYFLIILFLGLGSSLRFKSIIYVLITVSTLGFVGLVWTSVKNDYRSFLNSGTSTQTIQVSRNDAANKLYGLSNNITEQEINSSIYGFLDRLQYTYHFALTIDRVPALFPYSNGTNWLGNLAFVFTPRILNPDKPVFQATEKTKKYSGIEYSGLQQGSSFSLGYFAECYIDFGLWGMMIPLFLLGCIYGVTYYYFMRNASKNYLFNYAIVGAFFMEFYAFEMDGTYLLGRYFASFVTFFVLQKLVFPKVIKYISN